VATNDGDLFRVVAEGGSSDVGHLGGKGGGREGVLVWRSTSTRDSRRDEFGEVRAVGRVARVRRSSRNRKRVEEDDRGILAETV